MFLFKYIAANFLKSLFLIYYFDFIIKNKI